ncbi:MULTISPECIES: hypothetical protein [unclassified Thioalkalivibrio]|uniref:hypothetical protein n=1 Tax=unclassified Thioalkalivibrio TaxID=2621013 RepID=UPI00039B103D|nr:MULTISPECIES: hypothetical protein [unclassified Thioalkalivibrio]
MDVTEAKILLKNLFARLEAAQGGGYSLQGKLTDDEYDALRIAVGVLETASTQPVEQVPSPTKSLSKSPTPPPLLPRQEVGPHSPPEPTPTDHPTPADRSLNLDTSVLELNPAPENIRLCLDFGTAMSKATLVQDGESDYDDEIITVINLGEFGDDIEDYKLHSAVYIDDDGNLWFGADAEEYCGRDAPDGSRQLLDNIKHWLSLGQVDATVDGKFNPTDISVTYADIILAYLTFLTWSATKALGSLEPPPGGYPRNLNRRFAMPCLSGPDFKEVQYRLRKYIGEAQILADTFFTEMRAGLPLARFVEAVRLLRQGGVRDYKFVREGITEPLGVAGTLLNYQSENSRHMVVMVIDVGAGTTDFSVYRMHVDPERDISIAVEAANSTAGVTEAGNHLDLALMGLILQACGIDPEQGIPDRIQWYLQRHIREFKEELFDQGSILVSLPDGSEASIKLEQFMETPGVLDFKNALDKTMVGILESINKDWIDLIGSSQKIPYLTVALTGGGSSLPMVRELTTRDITVRGKQIRVVPTKNFPTWLEEAHSELELDYPRIAVSLGGARKKLIKQGGTATATAGGVNGAPVYDDPKYQW